MGPGTDDRVFERTRAIASVCACVWVTFSARTLNVDVCVGHIVRLELSHHNFIQRWPTHTHKHALSFGFSLKCGQEGSSDRFLINADPNMPDG